MTILQERLQEALIAVRLGMDEVEKVRDRCLLEMKRAVSDTEIMHMSGDSDDVSVIVQNDDRTKAILKEYEEVYKQMLRFIEVKHAIRKALM